MLRHLNKKSSYKLCQGARYTSPSIVCAGACPSHRGCDLSLPTTLLGASENFLKPRQWPRWVLTPTANPWLLLLLEHKTQAFGALIARLPPGDLACGGFCHDGGPSRSLQIGWHEGQSFIILGCRYQDGGPSRAVFAEVVPQGKSFHTTSHISGLESHQMSSRAGTDKPQTWSPPAQSPSRVKPGK